MNQLTCPKCALTLPRANFNIRYHNTSRRPCEKDAINKCVGEHIHYYCFCGYDWWDVCADARPAPLSLKEDF